MNDLASLFYERTGKKFLRNINHIDNIPSIMRNGLLSYERVQMINHQSIAMENVQDLRHQKRVPNGLRLHQYASLYFSARNPMMFYRKCHTEKVRMEDLCVLLILPNVLEMEEVVISDGNAASNITRFYTAEEGLRSLDFQKVFAEWWNADDYFEKEEKKRVKCAEVLVPYGIPYEMVSGAVVPYERTKNVMQSIGFDKQIWVHPDTFFLKDGV